jgi:hypothetical protein
MVSKVGLYAYGLVGKSPKQLNILGIDKKNKVYPVEGRGICVMVSKIYTDKFQDEIKKLLSKLTKTAEAVPNETEEILRGHEDVVDALMKLTTVVPFKFGTILKDEEAASKMLQDYGEKFKKLLSKFSGREEWGLKVYVDNQEFKKHLAKVEPRLKKLDEKKGKLSKGAAYLLGRKMEEESKIDVSARLNKASEGIFQEAGEYAYESKLNKTLPQKLTGKNKEMILNTAYLIEKGKVVRFCKQVKKLIEKYESMGIEIELSGPWPPYSFT